MNHLQDLCYIFHNSMNPEHCYTKQVLNNISQFVKPHHVIATNYTPHKNNDVIIGIENSTKINTLNFPIIKLKQIFLKPETQYHVRTIFYRDGSCSVRLYRNKDWKVDRPKTDILNFLVQLHIIDPNVILNFEKLIFQNI